MVKKRIIYRVEDPKAPEKAGQGHVNNTAPNFQTWWGALPTPGNDGIKVVGVWGNSIPPGWKNWVCGTRTKGQIFRWFNRFYYDIAYSKGAKIYILEVPEKYTDKGRNQVVFDRSKAKVIGELWPNGHRFMYAELGL